MLVDFPHVHVSKSTVAQQISFSEKIKNHCIPLLRFERGRPLLTGFKEIEVASWNDRNDLVKCS